MHWAGKCMVDSCQPYTATQYLPDSLNTRIEVAYRNMLSSAALAQGRLEYVRDISLTLQALSTIWGTSKQQHHVQTIHPSTRTIASTRTDRQWIFPDS